MRNNMRTNIFKLITLLGILHSVSIYSEENGAKVQLLCYNAGSTFDVIGDSRSFLFWGNNEIKIGDPDNPLRTGDALNTAMVNGKFIFPDKTFVINNRAVPGSHSSGWVTKIRDCQNQTICSDLSGQISGCQAQNSNGFMVANRSMLSIGGNDLLSFYGQKKGLDEQYNIVNATGLDQPLTALSIHLQNSLKAASKVSLRAFLNNPIRTFATLLGVTGGFFLLGGVLTMLTGGIALATPLLVSGATLVGTSYFIENQRTILRQVSGQGMSFAAFWDWQTNTKTDEIVKNTDIIIRHILDQSPDHRIIMNTVSPVSLGTKTLKDALKDDLKEYPMLLKSLQILRMKYVGKMFPPIMKKYLGRALPLDLFDEFTQNILNEGNRYFSPTFPVEGVPYTDGVHFSQEGNKFWGKQMALIMATFDWFKPSDEVKNFMKGNFYYKPELNAASAIIDLKALEQGIDIESIQNTELKGMQAAYKKDFAENTFAIYNKAGNEIAYELRGNMLHKYRELGEANGVLGAPMTEEFCWGPNPTCPTRIAFFEKGFILDDALGGTNPVVNV